MDYQKVEEAIASLLSKDRKCPYGCGFDDIFSSSMVYKDCPEHSILIEWNSNADV